MTDKSGRGTEGYYYSNPTYDGHVASMSGGGLNSSSSSSINSSNSNYRVNGAVIPEKS